MIQLIKISLPFNNCNCHAIFKFYREDRRFDGAYYFIILQRVRTEHQKLPVDLRLLIRGNVDFCAPTAKKLRIEGCGLLSPSVTLGITCILAGSPYPLEPVTH